MMVVKNQNFIEKYIEKIILGAGAVLALAVLWFFVIAGPYTVNVGGQNMTPDQLEHEKARVAHRLQAAINNPHAPAVLANLTVIKYTEAFQKRLNEPVLALARYPSPFGSPGLDTSIIKGPISASMAVYVPKIPVPTDLKERAGHAVLGTADDPAVTQQLIALVGAHKPADFRYVSVMATFPMDKWKQRLTTAGPEGQRIPPGWWDQTLVISDVELLRQERDPNTGQWEPQGGQVIAPLPGDVTFRAYNRITDWQNQQPQQIFNAIHANQQAITEPPFVPIAAGPPWVSPDIAQIKLSEQDQLHLVHLREQIERLEKELKILQTQAAAQQQTGANPTTRSQPRQMPLPQPSEMPMPRSSGPGAPGAPGALPTRPGNMLQPPNLGGTTPKTRTPANAQEQRQQRIDTLTQEIQKRKLEEQSILQAASPSGSGNTSGGASGANTGNAPAGGPTTANNNLPAAPGPGPAGLPNFPFSGRFGPQPAASTAAPAQVGPVKVWAHDITAKPGHTYRYALRVFVLNPLFHRNQVTPELKKEYYDKLSMAAPQTPWTDPVTLDPNRYFFAIAGSKQTSDVRVSVWRLYDGSWRHATFDVRPGDRIGGSATVNIDQQPTAVDLSYPALVVDTDFNAPPLSGSFGNTTRLIYFNTATSRMNQRVIERDQDNPTYIRLQNEVALAAAKAESANNTNRNRLGPPSPFSRFPQPPGSPQFPPLPGGPPRPGR